MDILGIFGSFLASLRSLGRDLVFQGIPGENHSLPKTRMSPVLIKGPCGDKEIIYLKLMSKANYCSSSGQGQRVQSWLQANVPKPPTWQLSSEPTGQASAVWSLDRLFNRKQTRDHGLGPVV